MDARIAELEIEIAVWRATNSQSNPGAMMELRAMRKELESLQKLRSVKPPKKESTGPKKDETRDR